MTTSARNSRTITDGEGTTWEVSEAYGFDVPVDAHNLRQLSVLWFETESGRSATAHVPLGALATLTDEDLLEFLRLGTGRQGRQP